MRLRESALSKWGRTEEKANDEVDEVVWCGVGRGDGGAACNGSGSEERAAETGAEPVAGGVGAVE